MTSYSGEGDGSFTPNFYLNAIQGVLVYTLFYQVCILGPIDMAKVWMLRSNIKVIGIFYCILCGFSYAIQSVVLEQVIRYLVTTNKEIIKNNVSNGIYILLAQDLSELFACLIALFAVWPVLQEERREVKIMKSRIENHAHSPT